MRNRTEGGSVMCLVMAIALAVVCGGLRQEVCAQCETKILASDGGPDDHFGSSVSIHGDIMIIGAPATWGSYFGSVYVYRYDSNETEWIEETRLWPSDGEYKDYFSRSLSICGNAIVVGAYGDDDNGDGSGSAYVYRYDGYGWIEEAKLLASDGESDDRFGWSVSIDGDVIVVGAYADDENGSDSGSAYVYRYNGSEWIEEAKLLDPNGPRLDRFGDAVAIDNDTIVVGTKNDSTSFTGPVYVYRYDGHGWTEEAQLLASDGWNYNFFGDTVAIERDVIVVGAEGDRDIGRDSGAVYVFRHDGSGWAEEAKLLASDGVAHDYFGRCISVDGNVIVIGSEDEGNGEYSPGSVYVFRYDSDESKWIEEVKLFASDGDRRDYFGGSVSIDGDSLVVGMSADEDYGRDSGSVLIYDLNCDPTPVLGVSPNPLSTRQNGRFTGTNLNPNTPTYLAYSFVGLGSTYVPRLNITLDLAEAMRIQWMKVTDPWGHTSVGFDIPNELSGQDIWFQMCQYELKTNVVETSIE